MNTTDLLLQMTLAATQIAQNTAPPVSDRTEDAGDRRDFSTLLAEKRVEAAERRPDAQFQRAKRVRFRLRPMGCAQPGCAVRTPGAGAGGAVPGLLMGARQRRRVTHPSSRSADCGSRHGPSSGCGGRRAVLPQPGQQTAGGEQLPVPAEPALAGEAESTVQAEVLPAAEDGGTATAQAVTPAAREARRADPGGRWRDGGPSGPRGAGAPELDSVQTEGAAQRSLTGQSTCR